MKKAIGVVLIVVALVLGYIGVNKFQKSTGGVKVGSLEIEASDTGGQKSAYVSLGLAVVALVGGIVLVASKEK